MKQEYLSYALEKLEQIMSIPSPSGYTEKAAAFLMEELQALGYEPQLTNKGGVTVDLGGESENALLLSCHVDTLGGMVAEIKSDGRLRMVPIGAVSPHNIEAENVLVHTGDGATYEGTVQLVNASFHVNKALDTTTRTFNVIEVVLDERTKSAAETRALGIEVGDFISFDPKFTVTKSGYIKSRFLDDKLSSCILLAYARHLKLTGQVPKRRVYIHFTVYEEIGHGASAYCPEGVTEIIGVDMGCVGDGLVCDEHMVSICAKDSAGPSDYKIVRKLVSLSKERKLNYAVDVYPAYVSDPDATLKAGFDVRHCVIGAGVYASHGYERSHIDGLVNTYKLVEAYIENS